MITLIAGHGLGYGSVRFALPEGVKEVPGTGAPAYVELVGSVTTMCRDLTSITTVASLLTGVKHIPLRESILVLDGQTNERLAYVEKL